MDHLGFFFAQFIEVSDISPIKNKINIVKGDLEIWVIVTRKKMELPNTLLCGERPICIVVESRLPRCCAWGAACDLSKACPRKRPEPQPETQIEKRTKKLTSPNQRIFQDDELILEKCENT